MEMAMNDYPKVRPGRATLYLDCWVPAKGMDASHKVVPVDAQVFEAGEKVLVIRRDENGEWPEWAVTAMCAAWINGDHDTIGQAAVLQLDALEGGQG